MKSSRTTQAAGFRQRVIVNENDVLSDLLRWARADGWSLAQYSPSKNQVYKSRITDDVAQVKALVSELFGTPSEQGYLVVPNSTSRGADAILVKRELVWAIECKGLTSKPSPYSRSEAVASVVSEYGAVPECGLEVTNGRAVNRLGLCLPDESYWREFRNGWFSDALRARLDLWFLWRRVGGVTLEPPSS